MDVYDEVASPALRAGVVMTFCLGVTTLLSQDRSAAWRNGPEVCGCVRTGPEITKGSCERPPGLFWV